MWRVQRVRRARTVEVSQFRGYAGEAVVQLVRPRTLFTALPILVLYLLLGGILEVTGLDEAYPGNLVVMLLISSYLVGRFALPAADGHTDAGFISQSEYHIGARFFAVRYLVITVLWCIPTGGLLYIIGKITSPETWQGLMYRNWYGLGLGGASILLMVAVAIILVLAPTLSFLVCTLTDELSEVFSLEPCRYLGSRGADLVVFFSTLIGGMLVFFGLYFVPLMVLSVMAGSVSGSAAQVLILFAVLLPTSVWPILMGRLCGGFAHYDTLIAAEEPDVRASMLSHADPEVAQAAAESYATQMKQPHAPQASSAPVNASGDAPSSDAGGSPHSGHVAEGHENRVNEHKVNEQALEIAPETEEARSGPSTAVFTSRPLSTATATEQANTPEVKGESADALETRVRGLSDAEVSGRIFSLDKVIDQSESLPQLYEYQLLMLRKGESEKANKTASKLILLSIDRGNRLYLEPSFLKMGEGRFQLHLMDSDWKQLHHVLFADHHYADAATALSKAATRPTDKERLPAQLLAIMEHAKRDGATTQALKVAQFLVKHHPDEPEASAAKKLIAAFT